MKHRHAQKDETNGNIEFLQPYTVVVADALLENGTAVISAVLSLDEHLSEELPVSRNFVVLLSCLALPCQDTHY
jgi:hypothetical protein